MSLLPRPVRLAQRLVEECLNEGDVAIDATAGNGHDTVYLASLVGEAGRVFAFDLQEAAIEATRDRCRDLPQVMLIQAGHETMKDHVDRPASAIMFNLGYLPGGDKTLITTPTTTVAAIGAGLDLLQPGGIMTVVLYGGHPGGEEEAVAVADALSRLDQEAFSTIRYEFLNQKNTPPFLLAVERR